MEEISPEVEEYLETIYRKKEKGETAKTNDIAKELGISAPSVSEMLRKLAKNGMIEYEPYRGAVLTKKGEEIGRGMVRKHRLIEKFLMLIGVGKRKVHDEACLLEHALSDEVERALRAAIASPKLPEIKGKNIRRLIELREGEYGIIAFIAGGRGATQRLADMGMTPGTKVKVERVSAIGGPVALSVRGSMLAIGMGLASKVFVEVKK